jgi:hypothetical protein
MKRVVLTGVGVLAVLGVLAIPGCCHGPNISLALSKKVAWPDTLFKGTVRGVEFSATIKDGRLMIEAPNGVLGQNGIWVLSIQTSTHGRQDSIWVLPRPSPTPRIKLLDVGSGQNHILIELASPSP